jgi:predicted transposase YbfD/YdcC
LIAVKRNQPSLFTFLQSQFDRRTPDSRDYQQENTRDRSTQRTVKVLNSVPALPDGWVGVERLVRVERQGRRKQKPYHEVVFYISSERLEAAAYAARIRSHWQIENRLHWPKDVVLKEDVLPVCDGYALSNFGILRTIAVNLFRNNGYDSITQGIDMLAHDVKQLFSFFQ